MDGWLAAAQICVLIRTAENSNNAFKSELTKLVSDVTGDFSNFFALSICSTVFATPGFD